jgi:hypothetical protein
MQERKKFPSLFASRGFFSSQDRMIPVLLGEGYSIKKLLNLRPRVYGMAEPVDLGHLSYHPGENVLRTSLKPTLESARNGWYFRIESNTCCLDLAELGTFEK